MEQTWDKTCYSALCDVGLCVCVVWFWHAARFTKYVSRGVSELRDVSGMSPLMQVGGFMSQELHHAEFYLPSFLWTQIVRGGESCADSQPAVS